jgi:hypothetical protein
MACRLERVFSLHGINNQSCEKYMYSTERPSCEFSYVGIPSHSSFRT